MSVGGRTDTAPRARERGSALLEEAVVRSRPSLIAGRVHANVGWVAQAALATAAAWVLAHVIFGHARPIFAPVAALIGVSASLGQRRRSAIEMVIGVALGIGIADALVVTAAADLREGASGSSDRDTASRGSDRLRRRPRAQRC